MSEQSEIGAPEAQLLPLAVDYAAYRRRVIFQSYKWDPQVGDVNTVSDHACVLSADAANRLSRCAEALAAETAMLEDAVAQRPDLHAELGIPRKLRMALASPVQEREKSIRVMRFDFHPTPDGWALSEVNSDVPGGLAESSALPELAAPHVPGARACGDVAQELVAALMRRVGAGKRLGLVHATAYADDRQVMEFLASRFTAAGFDCALLAPDHVHWTRGLATSIAEGQTGLVDAIIRFFPAEWLPGLPRTANWRGYFSTQTVACNPPHALLSQSKRLPLLWNRLGVPVPTWRALMPETRDPRDAPWRRDESWLIKPTFGRVGEDVAWRGAVPAGKWRRVSLNVFSFPRAWVAQRRFVSRPLMSHAGARHLCVGVFTVDGRAAGFYGRLSTTPLIEKHAQDVPVLIAPREAACH